MRTACLMVVLYLLQASPGRKPLRALAQGLSHLQVATNGGFTVYRLPNVSEKWFDNAQKKFAKFVLHPACSGPLWRRTVARSSLSTQSSAFNGLYPVYQTKVSTSSGPLSGNGTITDSQGSTWNYTYRGNFSSTTTTKEQTSLPYTDTTLGHIRHSLQRKGIAIAFCASYREFSRQGWRCSRNTLGNNIGARLVSIHIKEHLLDEIVGSVNAIPLEQGAHYGGAENCPRLQSPKAEISMQQSTETANGRRPLSQRRNRSEPNLYAFANGRESVPLAKTDDIASSAIIKCIADAKSSACFDNWTDAQKSFAWVLELGSVIHCLNRQKDDLLGTVADDLKPTWTAIRDVIVAKAQALRTPI